MRSNGQPVGFLVVGAGFLGAQRAAAVASARGTRLIAVHDCRENAAEAVASRHRARPSPTSMRRWPRRGSTR